MKFLLLLLLLTSWTHLGSEAQICTAKTTLKNQLVNIEESLKAKADAYFIKAYRSENLETCLKDCCSSKYGKCSVAAYKDGGRDWTCIHCFCEPFSLCKFFNTTVADSFIFPQSNSSTPASSTNINELVTPVLNLVTVLKENERSVSARKGVDNLLVTGNYMTDQEHNSSENISEFREHISSVKPRKGVDFYNYSVTSPLSNVSVIKPRKGVETEDNFGNHNSKSKIKPRKGVVPFVSTPLPSMPSLTEILQIHTLEQHNDSSHNKSDLLSFLKNVFADDSNITETKVPETTFTSTSVMPSAVSRISNMSTIVHPTPVSIRPTATSSSSPSETAVPHELKPLHDEPTTVGNAVLFESFTLEPELDTSFETPRDQKTLQFSSTSSLSSTTLSSDATVSLAHSKPEFTALSPSSSTVESGIYHSTNLMNQSVKSEIKPSQTDDEENDRRYKSSMHLVFGLVFGLLVVFGVFGAIAKRVYDTWVRRHYRRMDFLIDGMYDGYS